MTTTTRTTRMTMGSQQVPDSLVNKLHNIFSHGLPFVPPFSNTNEFQLVRAVLQMLQGFSTSLFYWDDKGQTFRPKTGVYLTHLSHTSLSGILSQFIYTATSLKLVEIFIDKVDVPRRSRPTLKAFANSVSAWLKRLRHTALQEEEKIVGDQSVGTTPTLLGLSNALSSLCSGAEYLLQVVHGAVPSVNLDCLASIPASEMALNILDHLYNKLNEVCLVQGGEEEAYLMLLFIFVGSALPYVEALDAWLYDGILDDPYEELFFYANNAISISQAEFWQKSYLLRPQCRAVGHGVSLIPSGIDGESMTSGKMPNRDSISSSVGGKDQSNIELGACPSFLKDIAKAIVSAGKSLQLIQHIPKEYIGVRNSYGGHGIDGFVRSGIDSGSGEMHRGRSSGRLTLSEIFCISLAGLIGDGDHISKYFRQDDPSKSRMEKLFELYMKRKNVKEGGDTRIGSVYSEQTLFKLLVKPDLQKGMNGSESSSRGSDCFLEVNEGDRGLSSMDYSPYSRSFCAENPVITVCQALLNKNRASHDKLVVSRNFHLPPLNDKSLCQAIFGEMDGIPSTTKETNYMFGFQFEESQYFRSEDDMKRLEVLFPFPTILPSFQEDLRISELFPLQENSTLTSRVLNWIQSVVPQATPLPAVIMQECLVVYIKKQVNCVGQHILLRLMHGWRLMDELGVLRAIYLLGSGDLLQQFLTVVFNKLDKRESWDDDFELNTVLQESIRNSADNGMLLNAPDSLVVSITNHDSEGNEQHNPAGTLSTSLKGRSQHFGIDALDMLKFTYKVSWPLELIANSEAIKKYNQVMAFLLKVKRAKFVLDKARRWMWKGRGTPTINQKHHWLVEQKLLHFVDAFHQYVMDRVFHNSWLELCEGMALAGSLDEVIEVHEAYLLSIQRQCFVAPDKLWALIASRIKSILGLALDFYSVQQTLSSSGAALAIKARCEMEVDRIEKQFDDCIAFLLRILSFKLNVGHFPHLADLVTRINYNYYYMSDSGNLITVPGSETAVFKPGKSFPVRSD